MSAAAAMRLTPLHGTGTAIDIFRLSAHSD